MISELPAYLSLSLVVFGAGLLIVAVARPNSNAVRQIFAAAVFLLMLHYFFWRATSTLPAIDWTLDFVTGVVCFVTESGALLTAAVSLVFLSKTRHRTSDVDANKAWLSAQSPPLIDVFVCTFNEERSILERTIIGAMGMEYPNYRVWVLDDGRRPWLQKLTNELGCRYLTRADNVHAKAGNINNALRHVSQLPDPPHFISILDADFVPLPQFLSRAMCLFRDPVVGIVQTPQHFINPDPIQTNLAASEVWPDEQRFFFEVILPSKDAWGTAFCCGTSSLIRFDALTRIGGFPTDSVTEDYLLTLRMKEAGYTTVYLNEPLTFGLAPEGLKEYITQRGRWCLGFMQIVRGRSGPFSPRSKLDFVDRLSLVDSLLGWVAVYISKITALVVPTLFLVFGIRAVDASLSDLLEHFLPFFVAHSLMMNWISGGRSLAIMSDVAQLVAAPAILKAIFVGLLKPKGHKFKVTAKGGDRNRRFVEWPLIVTYAPILALTLIGIAKTFAFQIRGDALTHGGLAFAWSWYNLVLLAIVGFVCIEQPRRRKAERFESREFAELEFEQKRVRLRLSDISVSGARMLGRAGIPLGSRIVFQLRGHSANATVVRNVSDGFAVHFDDTLESRVAMVRSFYTGNYVRSIRKVKAASLGRAILARMLS